MNKIFVVSLCLVAGCNIADTSSDRKSNYTTDITSPLIDIKSGNRVVIDINTQELKQLILDGKVGYLSEHKVIIVDKQGQRYEIEGKYLQHHLKSGNYEIGSPKHEVLVEYRKSIATQELITSSPTTSNQEINELTKSTNHWFIDYASTTGAKNKYEEFSNKSSEISFVDTSPYKCSILSTENKIPTDNGTYKSRNAYDVRAIVCNKPKASSSLIAIAVCRTEYNDYYESEVIHPGKAFLRIRCGGK